ncbi:UDP-N-acetylmuramoylalanine--D-glutamate ligase [Desulfitispora alkaliphila]|uniref:UDP-N-acetylmuramoyl-L-alanine--D-glutamate ligase n=1 Tax=Desulfitispora alkaliphila TaxID=622674 RepID=UPI003D234B2E
MKIKNAKKTLVIGMGKSGQAAVRFLATKGLIVDVFDSNDTAKIKEIVNELAKQINRAYLGVCPEITKGSYDFVVISPGVPMNIQPITEAVNADIEIISELELAYFYINATIVAITGTNGKTTTTALTHQIVKDAGERCHLGGNIGTPLLDVISEIKAKDKVIAEVSSFQLENTKEFKPKVAAILNLSPDHLDRHGTFSNYIAAKAKIFANQETGDYTVLNYDDEETKKLSDSCPGTVIFFSCQHTLEQGVFVRDNQIVCKFNDNERESIICNVEDVHIKGEHNLENALAATAIAYAVGINSQIIKEVLMNFKGVKHRLEFVDIIDGVEFVNDSKGTNPDAAIKAVKAYDKPIILIAGGKDKGSDFSSFMELAAPKLKSLIVLGETADKINNAALKEGVKDIHRVKDYPEAVQTAKSIASSGDVVLLSPACASWDMFNSFEERGELFKKLVRQLGG